MKPNEIRTLILTQVNTANVYGPHETVELSIWRGHYPSSIYIQTAPGQVVLLSESEARLLSTLLSASVDALAQERAADVSTT